MAADTKGSPAWKEKAGSFLSSSSMRLREFASKAGTAAAGAAEVTGSRVKSTWETTVQPRVNAGLSTAARVTAETGSKIRTGFIEVRDKAAATGVGQRISETTRASFERSRTLLSRVNFGQRNGRSESAVFGIPLEVVVQRQVAGGRPVPRIVALCSDYLLARGLTTQYLFESEGSRGEVMRLMKLFDQDANAAIPLGTSSLDVAQLLMVYFRSLPEPLLTYGLYQPLVEVGSSNVQRLREILLQLPAVNLATLQCLTGLLVQVAEKSAFNKMDDRSLATEFAPLLLWKKGTPGGTGSPGSSPLLGGGRSAGSEAELAGGLASPKQPSKESPLLDNEATPSVLDVGNAGSIEPDAPTQTSSDDQREQQSLVDVVLCMIEQHDAVFTNLRPQLAR